MISEESRAFLSRVDGVRFSDGSDSASTVKYQRGDGATGFPAIVIEASLFF